MRIVLISFSVQPTMQKYLYLLGEELRDLDNHVLTIGSSDVRIDALLSPDAYLVDTPDSPKPSLKSLVGAARSLRSIARRVESFNPDVIHFVNKHTWNYPLALMLSRQLKQTSLVHTFHDPIGHDGDSVQKGVIIYHKAIMRILDCIVVHSDIAERQTREVLRPSCDIRQVPLGVTRWRAYRPPARAPKKKALIFGRMNKYKGCERYPEILDALRVIDPQIEVVIAGKASADIGEDLLGAITKRRNATFFQRFIDEEEMAALFEEADIVLAPYTSITQSGVLLDAYCFSKPVVAFGIDGIRQYFACDELLCRPFDVREFADKAATVMSDAESLERLSKRSWEFGKRHFTPSAMALGMQSVYCALSIEEPR